MDLSVFFQKPGRTVTRIKKALSSDKWGAHIFQFSAQTPVWQEGDILLIGLPEKADHSSQGPFKGADKIRTEIYNLSVPGIAPNLVDMGNLKPKDSPEAFYEMLAYVMGELIKVGKTVLLLGGTQDMTYGQYMAYEGLNKSIEYVHIDSRFDAEDSDLELTNRSFNHKIFVHRPDYLFNYTNLGYHGFDAPPITYPVPQGRGKPTQCIELFCCCNIPLHLPSLHIRRGGMLSLLHGVRYLMGQHSFTRFGVRLVFSTIEKNAPPHCHCCRSCSLADGHSLVIGVQSNT